MQSGLIDIGLSVSNQFVLFTENLSKVGDSSLRNPDWRGEMV